jgi:hypothetical protein
VIRAHFVSLLVDCDEENENVKDSGSGGDIGVYANEDGGFAIDCR